MKKKIGLTLSTLALSAVMCLGVACGGNPGPGPGPGPGPDDGDQDQTYTIRFIDRGKVIYEATKKAGEKVTVPDDPNYYGDSDPDNARYTFTGWEGTEAVAGQEISVLESDKDYYAGWYEQFGSGTTFHSMQRNVLTPFTIDGEFAEWDSIEGYKLDDNGSELKIVWDDGALYLYAYVAEPEETDEGVDTQEEGEEGEATPAVENKLYITLDLLHSENLANDAWNGTEWGDKYRGGLMVEGGYTINLNAEDGAVEKTWEWLSNGGYGSSGARVAEGEDGGHFVEFKIDLTNGSIGDYKPHDTQEIGLAVRTSNGGALETFKDYGNHGPKSLSNVVLERNPANPITFDAMEVRENYEVILDGEEDALYESADAVNVAGNTIKMLWDKKNIYVFANLLETTEELEIKAFGKTVTFNESGEKAITGTFEADQASDDLVIKVNGNSLYEDEKIAIKLSANDKNFGRHLFEAKQLAKGATITVDGDRDAAYGAKVADVKTKFQNNPSATGEVYIRWDDEYLYVFVEVTDSSVCTTSHSTPYMCDSVELSIDTCQTHDFNTPTTMGYGVSNRPNDGYEGEGHFRMNPWGEYSWQGWIWMSDDSQGVFGGVECDSRDDAIAKATLENGGIHGYTNKDGKEWYLEGTAAKMTEKGYNVEYRMAWKSFGEKYETAEEKIGQVIGIMININDANEHTGGDRNGVMSLNSLGGESYQWSGVLDLLKLVAAD